MMSNTNSAGDATYTWTKVAEVADFAGRDAMQVSVANIDAAIFKVGEQFFATDAFCTHATALLCDGYVEGEEVECPLHSARFHIPTGKVLTGPAIVDLKTYPLKVVGGDILIGYCEN